MKIIKWIVLFFFLVSAAGGCSCEEPPRPCPHPGAKINGEPPSGDAIAKCCEVLKACCPLLSGKEKEDCEKNVAVGGWSSCQGMFNGLDSHGKCTPKE